MEIESRIFHTKIISYCFTHNFITTPHHIAPLACQWFFTEKTGIKVWVDDEKCYVDDEKFLTIE